LKGKMGRILLGKRVVRCDGEKGQGKKNEIEKSQRQIAHNYTSLKCCTTLAMLKAAFTNLTNYECY
jgi:hypothetical protein